MTPDIPGWYGLGGLNDAVFFAINRIGSHFEPGSVYEMVMRGITAIGYGKFFWPLFAAVLLYVSTRAAALYFTENAIALRAYASLWARILLGLLIAHFLTASVIDVLKSSYGIARPYVRLDEVIKLGYSMPQWQDYRAFPSGHASFTTVFLLSLWAGYSRLMKNIALFLIALMCVSRIALGVHTPMDVLAGVSVGAVIALSVRMVLEKKWAL